MTNWRGEGEKKKKKSGGAQSTCLHESTEPMDLTNYDFFCPSLKEKERAVLHASAGGWNNQNPKYPPLLLLSHSIHSLLSMN
jgi:hypothetical protein